MLLVVIEQLEAESTETWHLRVKEKERSGTWRVVSKIEELDSGDVTLLKEVPAKEAVGRRDDTAETKTSGILAVGVLIIRPTQFLLHHSLC
jgi:hypothetical protein